MQICPAGLEEEEQQLPSQAAIGSLSRACWDQIHLLDCEKASHETLLDHVLATCGSCRPAPGPTHQQDPPADQYNADMVCLPKITLQLCNLQASNMQHLKHVTLLRAADQGWSACEVLTHVLQPC